MSAQAHARARTRDPRTHLLHALGWASAGLAAIVAVSLLTSPGAGLGPVGVFAAGACVTGAIAGFWVIALLAKRINPNNTQGAHMLLWGTCAAYAWLINAFAASIGFGAGAETWSIASVPGAVAGTAGVALVSIAITVAIGTDTPGKRWAGAGGIVVVCTVAAEIAGSDMWWLGTVCGIVLARGVGAFLRMAGERKPHAAALAACLVAGISALALIVAYVIVRDAMRTQAQATAEGVRTSARH